MKLKEYTTKDIMVRRYEKYVDSILETEISDLSNSDLSFIKLVAPSSISVMKKKGKSNFYILSHNQKEVSQTSKKEKARKLLSSMSREDLMEFLNQNGFIKISESESTESTESSEESTESSEESTESSEESYESSEESTESSES